MHTSQTRVMSCYKLVHVGNLMSLQQSRAQLLLWVWWTPNAAQLASLLSSGSTNLTHCFSIT